MKQSFNLPEQEMPWTMPPEWAPHKRTWMAWPNNPDVFEFVGSAEEAYAAWAGAANAVSRRAGY